MNGTFLLLWRLMVVIVVVEPSKISRQLSTHDRVEIEPSKQIILNRFDGAFTKMRKGLCMYI